ncbi:hypothetical protein [Actinoalloteichus fjordicus]|uniref:ABC transporter n=1 Tax=Actinoalloteichus fjordicus TaxID=1612552 RepID=A0AAC9PRW9_9PSEU|nr:hypothetical protein [Actinoalloteichus fjordicus]APU14450.1 hypothetical protein UA74_11950 [Actinoalloteichus fjordicus]
MRTLATVRYTLADLLRSQLFLAPLLVCAGSLAVLFGGDAGAPPGPWAASVLLLYPASAWLAVAAANAEEPVQRSVTVVAAGGHGRVLAGVLGVCVLVDLLLVALAVCWPILTGRYSYPLTLVGLGIAAHLAAALAGTAVGLLCARPVLNRPGWTVAAASGVVLLTALAPWLPPVGTTVARLGAASATGGSPWPGTALDLGVAVLLLLGAAATTLRVARRR